jgi:hypothetical protein
MAGQTIKRVTEKVRPADTTAYAANDAIAESASAGTVWTFGAAGREGGGGTIVGAIALTDQVANVARLEAELYASAPTAINDNAEATLLYANAATYLGKITFPAFAKPTANSTAAVAFNTTIRLPFTTPADLSAVVRTLDAFTPASGQKVTIILLVAQD